MVIVSSYYMCVQTVLHGTQCGTRKANVVTSLLYEQVKDLLLNFEPKTTLKSLSCGEFTQLHLENNKLLNFRTYLDQRPT